MAQLASLPSFVCPSKYGDWVWARERSIFFFWTEVLAPDATIDQSGSAVQDARRCMTSVFLPQLLQSLNCIHGRDAKVKIESPLLRTNASYMDVHVCTCMYWCALVCTSTILVHTNTNLHTSTKDKFACALRALAICVQEKIPFPRRSKFYSTRACCPF